MKLATFSSAPMRRVVQSIVTGRVAELDEVLNFRNVPSFPADALHGPGVFETLRGISEQVLRKLSTGERR